MGCYSEDPLFRKIRRPATQNFSEYLSFWLLDSVAAQKFFCGGIEGAKCDSEGAKIQKFTENGWFGQFFSSDLGQVGGGGQSLWLGGICPPCPLDAATDWTVFYFKKPATQIFVFWLTGFLVNDSLLLFTKLLRRPSIKNSDYRLF